MIQNNVFTSKTTDIGSPSSKKDKEEMASILFFTDKIKMQPNTNEQVYSECIYQTEGHLSSDVFPMDSHRFHKQFDINFW